MAKPNISDEYFQKMVGKEITFDLISGTSLVGEIKEVGIYTLMLEVDKTRTLLFKDSIEKVIETKTRNYKSELNLLDNWLKDVEGEIIVALTDGEKINGKIRMIGKTSILLGVKDGTRLILKHAIKWIKTYERSRPGFPKEV